VPLIGSAKAIYRELRGIQRPVRSPRDRLRFLRRRRPPTGDATAAP
jgi:hypothetical protein